MDPQLSAQLAQTIYVASVTGAAESGGPTYGSPAAISARVESSTRQVRGADGSIKVTAHVIYTTTAINLNDRVWLPGADHTDPSVANIPLTVDAIPNEFGATDHYEVTV